MLPRRDIVWAALNDPRCTQGNVFPAVSRWTMTSPNELAASVKIKIGPVFSVLFSGDVALSNLNAPESYTISGEGKGGIAGFAKGGADVRSQGGWRRRPF